jgi:hypothetical protein
VTPTCACCATAQEARVRHGNRPWLSAIDYRLGTFASFRQALLDELASTRELRALQSRVSDDYAVSAIEMWAAVADVLTFYSERVANEAFLRTATLRDSVLRMARLLDYKLAPGAAATAELAFTLERDAAALIPTGTRVQSVPAQGETPQKYETLEPLAARGALNRLRIMPRPVAKQPLSIDSVTDIAAPDPQATQNVGLLMPGQQVIVFRRIPPETRAVAEILTVAEVAAHDDLVTVTWRQPPSRDYGEPIETWPGVQAYRVGRTFHLFGVDAPASVVASRLKVAGKPETAYLEQATTQFRLPFAPLFEISLDARYTNLKPGARLLLTAGKSTALPFDAAPAVIKVAQDASETLSATFADGTTTTAQTATVTHLTLDNANVVAIRDLRDVIVYELLGDPLRFWPYAYPNHLGTETVYVPGRRNGWSTLEVARTVEKGTYKPGATLDLADVAVGRRVIGVDDNGAQPVSGRVAAAGIVGVDVRVGPTSADQVSVERLGLAGPGASPMTVLVSASLPTTVFTTVAGPYKLRITIGDLPPQTLSLDPVLLGTGKLDGAAAALQAAIRGALPGAATFRAATVQIPPVGTEPALYVAAGVPGDSVVFSPSQDDVTTVTNLGVAADQVRWVDGILSAPLDHSLIGAVTPVSFQITYGANPPKDVNATLTAPANLTTLAMAIGAPFKDTMQLLRDDERLLVHPLAPTREVRSFLRLDLATDTPLALDPDSAGLLANVAQASHGETIHNEIVGDGDSSIAFQRFTLRKSPVTYVPAAVPRGIATTLQLFVNGARWAEVPTLYGRSSTDAVFATRLGDDGARTIQFGDGNTGSRVPTGRLNVVATYRQGLGLAGRVRAATLTNLLDRPTGVKGATNPLAAAGGADPESLDRARTTAPGTVRTFGRAISLRDFEDATLLAGEVAKATAAWVWTKRRRVVHLTVAGPGGAVFTKAKLAELLATLDVERDPNQRLLIDNYARVPVLVAATIMVEPAYVATAVLDATRAALLGALSFENRQFLDSVDLSDVYAVLQGVEGVRAVDIDRLDSKSTDVTFRKDHGMDPAKGSLQSRLPVLAARSGGSASTVLPAELPVIDVAQLDVVLRSVGGTAA